MQLGVGCRVSGSSPWPARGQGQTCIRGWSLFSCFCFFSLVGEAGLEASAGFLARGPVSAHWWVELALVLRWAGPCSETAVGSLVFRQPVC